MVETEQIQEESPYKFLDYYRVEDEDIFFGRKRETKILFSDVVVKRLVLLFAKTGTGKTSLINAGVRPLLEKKGYVTFFVRVKKDPVQSARECMLSAYSDVEWFGENLAAQLKNVAAQLKMPIVLFFDQFEEFFVYAPKDDPAKGRAYIADFVSNMAEIYQDDKSRVHVVFSMREEWFVEMDVFREKIPEIFHNESNLRLRWFDEKQAREAIKLPAAAFNVEIEDAVVEKILDDLKINGEVEPAQLQIVCDTLWRATEGELLITLAHYQQLAKDSTEKIAVQVLYRRLEDEYKKIPTEEELQILYVVLPKLRTPWKTKYVRDVVSLEKELISDFEKAMTAGDANLQEIIQTNEAFQHLIGQLQSSDSPLRHLIERLEDSRLIRRSFRDDMEVIELSHDYLVDSLDKLQERVKAIWPRQLLATAMSAYTTNGEMVRFEDFDKISKNARLLNVSADIAAAMFDVALTHGLHMHLWFDLTPPGQAWEILGNRIKNLEETSNIIDLLVDLHTPEAFRLLETTLSDEEIGSYAVQVIGQKESLPAVDFLTKALENERLSAEARMVLSRLRKSRMYPQVAARARAVLADFPKRSKERLAVDEALTPTEKSTGGSSLPAQPDVNDFREIGFASQDSLKPHYRIVSKFISDERIVFFLGAGVNYIDRPSNERWEIGHNLPTGSELAAYLAQTFGYRGSEPNYYDIARISQYIAVMTGGTKVLYQELHNLFNVDYPPNSLHHFLAGLPSLLRAKGSPAGGQIILTTNYDDTLERAFKMRDEPFELISYIANGDNEGMYRHWPSGESSPRIIERPNEYSDLLMSERTVILKISGGIDRSNPEQDSFAITEDDYIEQLARTDITNSIPLTLAARLRRSNFLFLGHGLRDWNVRVMLRRIWSEQRQGYKSWAIQLFPDAIERQLWLSRNVEILNMKLDAYIAGLHQHVSDFP